jgi:4-hydroxybenzoate polyprenyltransferase
MEMSGSPATGVATGPSAVLCVDLDGTLIRTDLFWESLFHFFRQHPWRVFAVMLWVLHGRAYAKRQLAANSTVNIATLPFNRPFLEWLRAEKASGRRLVLATAADTLLAERVADYLGIFDAVLASDGVTNLKGRNKARLLAEQFGGAFDYAGNSSADWAIWNVCQGIVAVQTPWWMAGRLRQSGRLLRRVNISASKISLWVRALRLEQWLKNLLVFAPLLASHQVLDRERLLPTAICFLSFGLIASATYLVNDLLDLAADRLHPEKKMRPLAAGELSMPAAVLAAAVLFAGGGAIAALASPLVSPTLVLYVAASLSYSLYFKRVVLLDVFVLAGLYTLRFVAGGFASGVQLSGWFLSFTIFLFLSLGFARRAAELYRLSAEGGDQYTPGRGYRQVDFQPVATFGIAAGFMAALVLTLYLQSDNVRALYRHPGLLWAVFPLQLYWLLRIWLKVFRGTMHEDPVNFAIRDPVTWILMPICAAVLVVAAAPW